jgi:hypothetical protein
MASLAWRLCTKDLEAPPKATYSNAHHDGWSEFMRSTSYGFIISGLE